MTEFKGSKCDWEGEMDSWMGEKRSTFHNVLVYQPSRTITLTLLMLTRVNIIIYWVSYKLLGHIHHLKRAIAHSNSFGNWSCCLNICTYTRVLGICLDIDAQFCQILQTTIPMTSPIMWAQYMKHYKLLINTCIVLRNSKPCSCINQPGTQGRSLTL